MAAAPPTTAAFYSLLLISLYITAAGISTSAAPTGSECSSAPDPSYCKSALPNQTGNVYSYGRSSVRKSLSSSQKFLRLVQKYLRSRSSLTVAAVRALEDCQLLAGLNIDYLTTSFRTVNSTSWTLPEMKAEDVQSLLSAILTNQQTCLDGLQATAGSWSLKNGLSLPLAADTKLYSMSLAFFTKGWVPKKKKKPTWTSAGRQGGFSNGRMSLKMSSRTKAIYETATRRNLLQTDDGGDDQISVRDIVVVSQDGSGNFTTINEAIAAAPNNSAPTDGYFLIFVDAGVYEEYVTIAKNKRYLMMIGDGINQTVVTGNRNVVDGWTTFNSATFAVVGPGFVAVNMTFRNTAGAIKHQAVAVRNSADLSTFYLCSFEGYQDTLYTHSLRQFYRDCDIYGTVDFIFGNAAVVLQNCNIYPRLPMANQFNAITAQGRTDPNQNTGTSIHNCRITAADDLANNSGARVNTFLGRPWKEYSRTVYMQSFMDDLINPAGWRAWDGDFALNTLYYAEFGNFGPGSNTSERVNWVGFHLIDDTDAGNFTAGNFLMADDWVPQTGVPYTSGLTE
ncbi:probable pectinesterase/pectinesterase inhibitor 7 isoform X1 [Cucurbita pepo subsp. pepo]|uniref:probable pectinesterase/pectinesterase inhibitor 7 isoform X1 n=2 Tax=Cucurbita pepo subsp. pepo TaxID=3664 RepID=UPI000C9D7EC8|nr:probable pectinesterase/pectinesterase inhibitor 7 isoform X1 [Cucurbita pepo subsp. pepo]